MKSLDATDRQILHLLQQDADMPMARLAEAVHLSPTPCWRRVQRLKDEGIIRRQVALLDAARLNLGVTVFVTVKTNRHSQVEPGRIEQCHLAADDALVFQSLHAPPAWRG
jgi:Lrp/AsnC family transcriptional regulator